MCRYHGGKAGQVLAAADRRLATAEVIEEVRRSIGARLVSLDGVAAQRGEQSPEEVLLDLITQSSIAVSVLGSLVARNDEVTTLDDYGPLGTRQVVRVEVGLWNEERDRLARFCGLAARLNLSERQVRIAEAQGGRIVAAVLSSLSDPEWGLSEELQVHGKRVIARHFRQLTAV